MDRQDHKTAAECAANEYEAVSAVADTAHWDADGQPTALYYAEIAAACKASYNAAAKNIFSIAVKTLDIPE